MIHTRPSFLQFRRVPIRERAPSRIALCSPGGGDTDGWGRAKVNIADSTNTLCVDLEVRSIGAVTAAHIDRGAAGVNGPPVVSLDPPDDGDEDDCDDIGDALADEIQANPVAFYVNVHTAEFPNGAIRGQLAPSAD